MKKKQAVRQAFRDVCLKRDNYRCVTCGLVAEPNPNGSQELEVHHIVDRSELAEDYKYVKENGISVCNPCHQKAEKFHISGGKEWVEGYHPDELYKLIGSRWSLALIEQFK